MRGGKFGEPQSWTPTFDLAWENPPELCQMEDIPLLSQINKGCRFKVTLKPAKINESKQYSRAVAILRLDAKNLPLCATYNKIRETLEANKTYAPSFPLYWKYTPYSFLKSFGQNLQRGLLNTLIQGSHSLVMSSAKTHDPWCFFSWSQSRRSSMLGNESVICPTWPSNLGVGSWPSKISYPWCLSGHNPHPLCQAPSLRDLVPVPGWVKRVMLSRRKIQVVKHIMNPSCAPGLG